jgi:hypothetical protein
MVAVKGGLEMKQGIARVLICAGFLGASLGITAEAQGRPAFDVNIVNTPVPVTIENGARTIVDFRYVGVSSTVDTEDSNSRAS